MSPTGKLNIAQPCASAQLLHVMIHAAKAQHAIMTALGENHHRHIQQHAFAIIQQAACHPTGCRVKKPLAALIIACSVHLQPRRE